MSLRYSVRFACVLLATPAIVPADAPRPFAHLPADANVLVRVDFEALANEPGWAPITQKLESANRNYTNAVIGSMAEENPAMADVASSFVGKVACYELGCRMESLEATAPVDYTIVSRGLIEGNALTGSLLQRGWTKVAAASGPALADAASTMVVATPDANTLVMAHNVDRLAGTTTAAQGPLAPMLGSISSRPVVAAVRLSAAQQEALAEFSKAPPQEAFAITGLPEAITEGQHLRFGAVALGEGPGASLELLLGFADEAAAARANEALNRAIPALAALGRSQAAGDAETLRQIEEFAALRFANDGPTSRLRIAVPPDIVTMAGEMLVSQLPSEIPGPTGGALLAAASSSVAASNQPIKIELLDEPAGSDEEPSETEDGSSDTGASGNMSGRATSAGSSASSKSAAAKPIAKGKYPADATPATVAGFIAPADRREFPLRSVPGVDGRRLSFSSYRDKVLIIDFWATWCGPCRQSTPTVAQVYKSFERRELAVIGISLDDDLEAMKKYANENGMAWPMSCDLKVWDSAPVKELEKTDFPVSGVPRFYVLDRQGRVAYYAHDWEPLGRVVQTLLAEAD